MHVLDCLIQELQTLNMEQRQILQNIPDKNVHLGKL